MAQIYDIPQFMRSAVRPLAEDEAPGWALGLRQLYKSALQEPLPADFGDLLARVEGRCASAGGF